MTTTVIRSDVIPPKGISPDKCHAESIQGVMVLTLGEYSLSADIRGFMPNPEDIGAVIMKFISENTGDEYSRSFAAQTVKV